MNDLPKKLKELREQKGLSPEQLAAELGLAKSTVWAYEGGKKQVSVDHLSRLADFFDISTDFLLDRTNRTVDLNLQNLVETSEYKLWIGDQPMNRKELEEAASYIQVKRRMGNFGAATT